MNETQLKKRAEKLTKRLASLGFTKDGNAPVVDQAYELIAAMEGFRNQHILRSCLTKLPLAIPRELDEGFAKAVMCQESLSDGDWALAADTWELLCAEAARRQGVSVTTTDDTAEGWKKWEGAIREMGWDDYAQTIHLEAFIQEKGLMAEFGAYAESVAADEIAQSAELNSDMSSRDDKLRSQADAAWNQFNLNVCGITEGRIVSVNGWSSETDGPWRRTVFVEDEINPDGPSIAYEFVVSFSDDMVVGVDLSLK